MSTPNIYIGVDLGQTRDYTAISVIDSTLTKDQAWRFTLRHLERPQLGTPYPEIVRRIKTISDQLRSAHLVVDATGVGAPVVDLMRESGLRAVAITITGGTAVTKSDDGSAYGVPKRDLVFSLLAAFQGGRVSIAEGIPLADTLVRELHNFRPKPPKLAGGSESYEAWREGDHDDIVLSVALATWYAMAAPTWLVHNP